MTTVIEQHQTYSDVDQAFTSREVPWLKMGSITDSAATTAAEAAELGGLNFTVNLAEVAFDTSGGNESWQKIDNRRAVVRSDTGDFFGFVSSSSYTPLQYAQAFDFMDTIQPTYVAAGTLRGGRQGFMVVKPEVQPTLEDEHELFAVLRTSHDCSRGIEVMVMPLRQRCMNQLTLRSFARGIDHRWSIKHTTTLTKKLAEAQQSLEKIGVYVQRYESVVDRLSNTAVKPDKARQLLELVIPMPKSGKTDRTETQWHGRLETITDLWTGSPRVGYAGTGWGLVNAVSEYFEWHRTGGTPESQLLNALEGETHKKINKMCGLLLSNV